MLDLFPNEKIILDLPDAIFEYYPNFLTQEKANMIYIANKCIKQEYQKLFLKISPVFPALKIN